MPPVVAAAAIGGAASLAGGALAARSAGKAGKLQAQSTDKALAFEREQEANRKAEYEQQVALKQKQWDAYQQARVAALRHYGVDVPDYVPSGGPTMGGGGPARQPVTLGSIAGDPRMAASMGAPQMGGQVPPEAVASLQGAAMGPGGPPVGPQGPQVPWDQRGVTLGALMRRA